jgi:hypothetical protein
MITVTTADSKYSRQIDFGGPTGGLTGVGASCPLRLNMREKEKGRDSVFGLAELAVT